MVDSAATRVLLPAISLSDRAGSLCLGDFGGSAKMGVDFHQGGDGVYKD